MDTKLKRKKNEETKQGRLCVKISVLAQAAIEAKNPTECAESKILWEEKRKKTKNQHNSIERRRRRNNADLSCSFFFQIHGVGGKKFFAKKSNILWLFVHFVVFVVVVVVRRGIAKGIQIMCRYLLETGKRLGGDTKLRKNSSSRRIQIYISALETLIGSK